VLYFLLTGKVPFASYNSTDMPELVMDGLVPKIAKKILKSRHTFDRMLRKAIKMCWTFDPKKCPRVREVTTLCTKHWNGYNLIPPMHKARMHMNQARSHIFWKLTFSQNFYENVSH
jgi:hypothetical protein